jgi:hypothetical protein
MRYPWGKNISLQKSKECNVMNISSESRSYVDLLIAFPPRTIKSEAELNATQEVIDGLIDKGDLTSDERDYY